MTTPPTDGLLFEVAPPPTPVERLMLLADQYVEHNDTLDRLLRAGSQSEPDAHVASAQRLASATRTAIKAVTDERLYESHELSDAVVRLQQLAFLSSASTDHRLPMARTLTALAPEAAMSCADSIAHEIRRRRWSTTDAPDHQLTATQRTALWEIACGHVVVTRSLGRQYVHYRDERVLIGTLRSLEANGLAERVPNSASSAYTCGPLQDRVRLTAAGITDLAAAISRPITARPPGTTPAPAPHRRDDGHPKPLTDPPEPHHPMPLLDLAEHAQQLHTLAYDFEALHARVRGVSYTPGTDALRQISPLLLMTQDLTATVLVRLGALDSSTYTSVAGSRASLECLASVVVASSLAGNDLASALHANPYEGAPFPGYPADDASVRTARHAEAISKMTGHLADAAHQLDLSATGCHYVATGITRDLAVMERLPRSGLPALR